jgi:hypothetical protein
MIKDDPLIKSILRAISEKIEERERLVCKGKISTFDEYKRHVGFIDGMESSIIIIEDCIKKYGNDEDDD